MATQRLMKLRNIDPLRPEVASAQHWPRTRYAEERTACKAFGVSNGRTGKNFGAIDGEIHADALRAQHAKLGVDDDISQSVVVS